jgi:hypothetical protein
VQQPRRIHASNPSDGEKMSSKQPREAIEEVEEPEAAAEACYRRRARRAGLAEMLPADRPMSEKELDTLSELLGDGIEPEPSEGGKLSR